MAAKSAGKEVLKANVKRWPAVTLTVTDAENNNPRPNCAMASVGAAEATTPFS
jgi:hypothetical protein